RALLEVAELQIKIALVLPPDDRDRRFRGQAFFAMTRAADLRLIRNCIRPSGARRREERGDNNATQHEKESFAWAKDRAHLAWAAPQGETKRPLPPACEPAGSGQ